MATTPSFFLLTPLEDEEDHLSENDERDDPEDLVVGTTKQTKAQVPIGSASTDAGGAWTQVRSRKPQKKKPSRSTKPTERRRSSSSSVGSFPGNSSTASSESSNESRGNRRKSNDFALQSRWKQQSQHQSHQQTSHGPRMSAHRDSRLGRAWTQDNIQRAPNQLRKPGAVSWHVPHHAHPSQRHEPSEETKLARNEDTRPDSAKSAHEHRKKPALKTHDPNRPSHSIGCNGKSNNNNNNHNNNNKDDIGVDTLNSSKQAGGDTARGDDSIRSANTRSSFIDSSCSSSSRPSVVQKPTDLSDARHPEDHGSSQDACSVAEQQEGQNGVPETNIDTSCGLDAATGVEMNKGPKADENIDACLIRDDKSNAGAAAANEVVNEGSDTEAPYDSEHERSLDAINREKLRAKIWNILFRNVTRTIDELYYMCEFDSSDEQCGKAEDLLSTCLTDFGELRARIQAQTASARQGPGKASFTGRPGSAKALAWEVRKRQAVPSPVTLLFGSHLQEEEGGLESAGLETRVALDAAAEEEMSLLHQRSLQSLNASSTSGTIDFNSSNTEPSLSSDDRVGQTGQELPKSVSTSSAWVRKPRIVTESPRRAAQTYGTASSRAGGQSFQTRGSVVLRRPTPVRAGPLSSSSSKKRVSLRVATAPISAQETPFTSSSPREEDLRIVSASARDGSQGGESVAEDPEESAFGVHRAAKTAGPAPSPRPSVFTFDDVEDAESGLRWGDEEVGLTQDAVDSMDIVSPNRKRSCDVCRRRVVPAAGDQETCSACLSKAGMLRTLHQKLSSPERRKPSPSETKRRQTQKQTTARLNREKIDLQRQAKLRLQTSRQEQIAKTKEEVMLAQNRAIHERLERAAVAREAKLKSVAKKAENEARKVNEVQFINEMTEQDRTAQLHKKLEDGEKRRLVFIGSIREKAEKQNERVEARRLREEDRERQLREAMQKRHEEAERRKAEALEEQRRKLDEMVIEASAKVSERRTEMEKEREAKLALQRERAERAEQERRRFLLAKRTSSRASTSSPLVPQEGDSQTHTNAGGSGHAGPGLTEAAVSSTGNTLASSSSSTAAASETGGSSLLGHSHNAGSLHVANPPTSMIGGGLGSNAASPRASGSWSAEEEAAEKARFAEEVSRSAEEMQIREKQMKKRARKVKARIATLSDPQETLSTSIQGKSRRLQGLLDSLRAGSEQKVEALDTLARLVRDSVKGVICEASLAAMIGVCVGELGKGPVQSAGVLSSALAALHAMCVSTSAVVESLLDSGRVTAVIDVCVQLLRTPVSRDNVQALIFGLHIVSSVLSCARGRAKSRHLGAELVRLCIYSSLALRSGERCAQIKCGKRWESTGCPDVREAVDFVVSSLGLFESMAGVVLAEHAKDSPSDTTTSAVVDTLREAASSSTLFRIVSQLVAAFIAVRGTHAPRGAARAVDADLEARLRLAAASGLRALNLMSCLDLEMVQEVLGSPALPFELQQLFRYVLLACEQTSSSNTGLTLASEGDGDAIVAMPSPPATDWGTMSEGKVNPEVSQEVLFAELIVFLGFYAQNSAKNQESLNWGRAPTPLTRLCSVPFRYFSSPVGKSILFPTLLAVCTGNSRTSTIVAEEISPDLLTAYLRARSERDESPTQAKRFPSIYWESALAFF